MIAAVAFLLLTKDANPTFKGERAFDDLVLQVNLGPRVPGSEAHHQAYTLLLDSLGAYTDRIGEQRFTVTDQHDTTKIYEGINIIASLNLNPKKPKRVMLAAHWDSRPWADRDPDPSLHDEPVPGANDGASGVAVLLEMARVLHATPPDIGVEFVLFDLEDIGDEGEAADPTHAKNPFALGSAYFAENFADYHPTYGILLDMVCDRNLRIPQEANSLARARPIVSKIWAAAEKVGATAFIPEPGAAVMDDHIAFLNRGIRVVDLIHTPFPPYWHTTGDTPDKCSVESLQQVGDVLVEVLYSE